jgi:hypothetical protein
MATSNDFLAGLPPKVVDLWKAQADYNADKVLVQVDRANITPAPTSAAWTYAVPFSLIGENCGKVIPYSGTIACTVGDDSTSGTATVSTATPTVTLGRGTVNVIGDAQPWLNGEVATVTLTYTNLRGSTDVDTFTVTFTT